MLLYWQSKESNERVTLLSAASFVTPVHTCIFSRTLFVCKWLQCCKVTYRFLIIVVKCCSSVVCWYYHLKYKCCKELCLGVKYITRLEQSTVCRGLMGLLCESNTVIYQPFVNYESKEKREREERWKSVKYSYYIERWKQLGEGVNNVPVFKFRTSVY